MLAQRFCYGTDAQRNTLHTLNITTVEDLLIATRLDVVSNLRHEHNPPVLNVQARSEQCDKDNARATHTHTLSLSYRHLSIVCPHDDAVTRVRCVASVPRCGVSFANFT